jgi:hypothetical protein
MQTHRRPGDLLVFNASWEDMAFRQYYREPFLKGGLPARLRPSPEEVSRDASRTVAGYRRLWLILCYDHITDPENLVRQWFDRNLENVMQRQFSQIEVLLYRNPEAEPR